MDPNVIPINKVKENSGLMLSSSKVFPKIDNTSHMKSNKWASLVLQNGFLKFVEKLMSFFLPLQKFKIKGNINATTKNIKDDRISAPLFL